ncbi:MAG: electron transfer flavoprotein subunit beta/FixA family protein [Thermoplasmatales archaeon]|jgi:electron transfer flavoprotein beta subunit
MLKMAVMIKQVPDSQDITIDPVTKTLNRTQARNIVNPPDMNALEAALQLKDKYGGEITVITMGPPMADSALLECTSRGADKAVLVTDRVFAGADTWPTSFTLATTAEYLGGFDIIFCGEETTDSSTGHVGPGIAEFLGVEQATYIRSIDYQDPYFIVEREIEGAVETLKIGKPAVVTVVLNANNPRRPTLKRKIEAFRKGVITITNKELKLRPECVGLKGSPTVVKDMKTMVDKPKDTVKIGPEEITKVVEVLYQRGIVKC